MVDRNRQFEVTGIEEFRKMTKDLAPKQARNLARATVQGVATEVAKQMRKKAPKDDGTLRKAIKARRRKMQGDVAMSDVRIEHGKGSKNDAWYWHFIEFGTQKNSAQPFIQPTVAAVEPQLPGIFAREFGKKLEKALAREAKKQGVKNNG
jgi:HK97 gp10 family phage protein